MFGFDEIYTELLNEARSPEEIKKILHYQFVEGKGVPEDIFEAILNVDPTKKKNYTRWVLMQWEQDGEAIESAVKSGQIAELFNYFKERSGTGLELGNMKSFSEALSVVPKKDNDPIFKDSSNKELPENNFDILYDTPEWRIAVPHTVEASVKLGTGCEWCTAGYYGNVQHYFNRYNSRGKLWVNFDKRNSEIAPANSIEYPYTRYQFCFEAQNGPELNNSHNREINLSAIDMPEDVFEFYKNENEWYYEVLTDLLNGYERDNDDEYRLNRCILRKQSVHGYSMIMIPTLEDNDVYAIYNSEDLTDPIDDYVYDEDAIYDLCEGFSMFILNSPDSEDKNIYYETESWGNHSYWPVVDNVVVFGGNDNLKYFADSYLSYIYFKCRGANENLIKEEIDKKYSVENIFEIKPESLPSDYNSGVFLQVDYERGLSSLLYLDNVSSSVKYVVSYDMPNDGDLYEIENDGENYFIRTKVNTIYLTNNEGNSNQLSVEEKMDNENFLIVSYPDDNAPALRYYGIYDINAKELIIGGAFDISEAWNFALLKYDGYYIFYDYESRNFVSEKCTNLKAVDYCYVYNPLNSQYGDKIKIFDSENGTEHGPFDAFIEKISMKVVVVKYNGKNLIYDVELGTFILPEKSEFVTAINHYMFIYRLNGREFVYDSNIDDTIFEIQPSSNYKEITHNYGPYHRLYEFTKVNGKKIVINGFGKFMLPVDADEIIIAKNQRVNSTILSFVNNNKVYFCIRGEKIYPTNGIPRENVIGYAILTEEDEAYQTLLIGIKINNKGYKVYYIPRANNIPNIQTTDNVEVTDEVERNNIEKLFFPEKMQISEQFRDLINRMDIL